MAFLDDAEMASLAIRQSVFHIVGPGEQHFQLLSAFDASSYSTFFLGRIRSVNDGNRYQFLDDSPVHTQLARIAADPATFQEESEKLATAFNAVHGGTAAVGAFLLFSLDCSSGTVFALLKFEDEKVLSYDYKATGSPRPIPIFGEIERTFVENRKALQKAALIRLPSDGDSICVVDRQNPHKPAAYFENFLRARRARSEAELTAKIVDLTMTVVRKHKSLLPAETVKSLAQRVYSASQSGGTVDGEKSDEWLKSIVGPLPDDSPILKDFRVALKREGMAGESFSISKESVPAPRNRRVETSSGVKITFPASLPQSLVSIDQDKGEIIIRDAITLNDVELERPARSRV